MYYARRKRLSGLGLEPSTFEPSGGAVPGPVGVSAPPRVSTPTYWPGVYTPVPRGVTPVQFVQTGPQARLTVAPTPKIVLQIPSSWRRAEPVSAPVRLTAGERAGAWLTGEIRRLRDVTVYDDQEKLNPEEAKERVLLAEHILAGKDIAELLSIPGLSSSNVKFLGRTLKMLEESTAAKVADILRTIVERGIGTATGYAARVPEIAEPAVKAVIKHGLRLSFATDAEKLAAKALAEEAAAASARVGLIAAESSSGMSWAGTLLSKVSPGLRTAVGVAGRGLETASGIGLVVEGVYDLTRLGLAYSAAVEAEKDSAVQKTAMRAALNKADELTRSLTADLSKLPKDIQNLENERARLDDKIKQSSLTVERLTAKQQRVERETEGKAGLSAREFMAQQELMYERDADLAKLQTLNQSITDRTAAFTVAKVAAEETAKIKRTLERAAQALEARRAREQFARTFESRGQELSMQTMQTMHGLSATPEEQIPGTAWAVVVAWTGGGMYGGWQIAANKPRAEKALYALAGGLLGFALAMYNKQRR